MMKNAWTRKRSVGAFVVRAVAFTGIAASVACSAPGRIDRKINELVQERSSVLDGGALAPMRTYGSGADYESPDQASTKVPTINPSADELSFNQADIDRDVASRLEEYAQIPENATPIDLETAFGLTQKTSREYKNAEEEYILAAIRLLIERHRWSPRFFDDLSTSVGGSFEGDIDTPLQIVNELRLTKRLPYGGDVEARLISRATGQLRRAVTDDYTQASSIVLSGNVPLLRNAGLIAREDLIQRERDLIYAARTFERFRRQLLVDIARDYLSLVALQSSIENQVSSLNSRRESFLRGQAQVEAGRRPAFSSRNLEQDTLNAQSQLINIREQYLLALDRFKIRLGIPVETNVKIIAKDIQLPEPASAPAEAARLALRYRLDLQNRRDQIDDARRDVANSRNQLLPDLNLAGGLTIDTPFGDRVGGLEFDFNKSAYNASVTFGLPLDREIERLNLRSSMLRLHRTARDYDDFRDLVILEARQQRRVIDQQRFRLRLAEQRIEINILSIEEQKIKEGNTFDLTRAEDDLLRAQNDRDRALRDLRVAVLDYLLSTGQLRVDQDGTFRPLPGMADEQEPSGKSDAGSEAAPDPADR